MKSTDPTMPLDPQRPTVHIVDDDLSHLRSIARLLRASGYHVLLFTSAAEFLSQANQQMTGCLITDLMMPEMDGRQLQDALHQAGINLPVIFLSGQGTIPTTVAAMRQGAEDFLIKNVPKEHIFAAIERAFDNDRELRAKSSARQSLQQQFSTLTQRELEVLRLVVRGWLNKQIAAELGIHERTVKLHRTNFCNKLGVHSAAELTRLAQHAGIID